MPHDHLDVVDLDTVARRDVRPSEAEALRLRTNRAERLESRHGNSFPHLARPKFSDDRYGAADMIGVPVRQDEAIEPAGAGGAQHGRDHAFADVERRLPREAAG